MVEQGARTDHADGDAACDQVSAAGDQAVEQDEQDQEQDIDRDCRDQPAVAVHNVRALLQMTDHFLISFQQLVKADVIEVAEFDNAYDIRIGPLVLPV